jgi:hypothetical protein
MGYAKEIGTALAETLEELVLSEETGVPLNEIRDLNSLQAAMSKFGKRHPHYQRLQALHARKTAIEAKKEHRMARQREIAASHGYRQKSEYAEAPWNGPYALAERRWVVTSEIGCEAHQWHAQGLVGHSWLVSPSG